MFQRSVPFTYATSQTPLEQTTQVVKIPTSFPPFLITFPPLRLRPLHFMIPRRLLIRRRRRLTITTTPRLRRIRHKALGLSSRELGVRRRIHGPVSRLRSRRVLRLALLLLDVVISHRATVTAMALLGIVLRELFVRRVRVGEDDVPGVEEAGEETETF